MVVCCDKTGPRRTFAGNIVNALREAPRKRQGFLMKFLGCERSSTSCRTASKPSRNIYRTRSLVPNRLLTIGKAQPRERSAREGPPAKLTSPTIELPFASRVVTRARSAHGSWVFQGFRGMMLSKEQNGIPRGGRRHLQQSTCWGGTHHEVPCPHGCRQSLRRKEFASPLGVRVCESLHEKQDRK